MFTCYWKTKWCLPCAYFIWEGERCERTGPFHASFQYLWWELVSFLLLFSQLPTKGNPLASDQKVWQGKIVQQLLLWVTKKRNIDMGENRFLISHPFNFSPRTSSLARGDSSQVLDQAWGDYNYWYLSPSGESSYHHKKWDTLIWNHKDWHIMPCVQ